MSLNDEILKIESNFNSDFDLLTSGKLKLEEIKYKYLGRKGYISNLYPLLSKIDNSEKPKAGQKINQLKNNISNKIDALDSRNVKIENIDNNDFSLPGKRFSYRRAEFSVSSVSC